MNNLDTKAGYIAHRLNTPASPMPTVAQQLAETQAALMPQLLAEYATAVTPEAQLLAAQALLANLGPQVAEAVEAVAMAHELPAGLLFAQEDARQKAQATQGRTPVPGTVVAGITPAAAVAPAVGGGGLLPASTLATLMAGVKASGNNAGFAHKLVATLGAGVLGQVVVASLQRKGVSAIAIGTTDVPTEILEGLHVLGPITLAALEAELPADLAQRLGELRAQPLAARSTAPVVTHVPPHLKAQAKLGRKVAGQQQIRRMLAQELRKSRPYHSAVPRPEQGTPVLPVPEAPAQVRNVVTTTQLGMALEE